MLKCVVNSWILLLFVATLGFPFSYGCEIGWFGPRCQYKCHCSTNSCSNDGLCTSDSKCVTGWFGPACQYVDLANSETVKEKGDVVSTVTDGDESSCLDQSVSDVTVTWNTSFSFTWLRVHTKTTESIKGLNVNFKNNISSSSTPCVNRKDITVSDTAMDVYCDTTGTTIQVIITGQGLQSLCSLYISGGRNVGLKENTTQSSIYNTAGIPSVSSNAVNGDKNGDLQNGQCACTDAGDKKPNLNLTFTNPVTVSRIFLYSRTDTKYTPALERLKAFLLRGFNSANNELFRFQDKEPTHRLVYTVQLTKPVSNVSLINVEATNLWRRSKMLSLCELEVFGDSVCPPGKFGLGCDRSCNCADEFEQCLVSNGGCVSGCAVGFTGEGCQDEIVCAPGYFGGKCETKCNCDNKTEHCNLTDGACISGCAPYFIGKGCQEKNCETGWFGPRCQYQCHCSNIGCNTDGLCTNGNKCVSGWFGPACQYVDLANSETVKEKGNVVSTVTDGDETSCLDQSVSDVTVTWNTSFSFTWLRIHTKITESIKGLNVNFKNNISSSSTPCENRRDITVNDTAIDVYCDTTGTTIQVIITGQGLQSLCSLYISGGRNVALKENTTQSSTYDIEPIPSVSSNAVNGNKSGVFTEGQCSCTAQEGDILPNLNLTFSNPVTFSRIIIYNRRDAKYIRVLSRLQAFILRGFGSANKELFRYQDKSRTHRPVYIVQLAKPVSNVSMVNVEATTLWRKLKMLTLCELEVFGDSVCPPGKFGLGCESSCHCVDKTEQCLVSTGGCISGCAVGFTGEGCQDE